MSSDTHIEHCHRTSCHLYKQTFPGLSRQGFTLIEVLVALSITMVLVLMVTNMFSQATTASNSGTERSEVETAGRAALGFISMKLSQAIAGPAEPSSPPFSRSFVLTGGSNVSFHSVSDTIQSNRFLFDGSNLVYYYGTNNGVLVENVVDVQIYAYPEYADLNPQAAHGQRADPFNCHSTNLPYCVDIGIKLISSSDNKRARQLSGADLTSFKTRNCRWYTTRVYFQLRQGYRGHAYGQSDADN